MNYISFCQDVYSEIQASKSAIMEYIVAIAQCSVSNWEI